MTGAPQGETIGRMKSLASVFLMLPIAWSPSALADDGPQLTAISERTAGLAVVATAAASRSAEYEVDEDAAEDRYEAMTRRNSPGLIVAGVLMAAAGGLTAGAGLVLSTGGCSDSMPPQCGTFAPRIVSIPMVIHGLVSLTIGVPLIRLGNKRVPRRGASAPELRGGAGAEGLRWSF
ncbi:MAG: hypothetical protein WKG00_11960 [Polyangiaceae bacterium]